MDLKIRETRNKLASHRDNYGKGKKKDAIFLFCRISLSDTNVSCFGNRAKLEELDLSNLVLEHSNIIIEMLDNILGKGISFIYKTNKRLKAEYLEKLEDIRQIREGSIVIRLPKRKKILIKKSHLFCFPPTP